MSTNIRPIALSAADSKLIAHGARSCFEHALAQVTQGHEDRTTETRPDARAVRHELALAMYRLAMRELDELLPAIAEPEPEPLIRDCEVYGEQDGFHLAQGSGPKPSPWPWPVRDPAEGAPGTRVLFACIHGVGDRRCTRCHP